MTTTNGAYPWSSDIRNG